MPTLYLKQWPEISGIIKKLKPQLHKAMEPVASTLKENYIYEIELPFGTDLIVKGMPTLFDRTFLKKCKYESERIIIDSDTFLNDFSNKNDHPLGLIQTGIVEIYESNSYKAMDNQINYNFPLNVLRSGELLGTFGATDLIHDSQLGNPHYTYSALCGNYCIYPLLPRDITTNREIEDKMRDLFKGCSPPFKQEEEQLLSFFPKLLKALYSLTNKTVKLFLIPDSWYKTSTPESTALRILISKIAWIQSRESRLYDSEIIPIMNKIRSNPSRRDHLFSEMIAYLKGILDEKRLIIKPVDENSQAHDIYLILKEKIGHIYDPILLHFDFLLEGEWGIFPLFIFPTINPIDTITNGKDFLIKLQSQIDKIYGSNPSFKKIEYHFDATKFFRETFPGRHIYTTLFLTRAIMKVQRS